MAIVNATDVVLKIDVDAGSSYVKILHATTANLTINREMRDSTTKDSSGWSESLAGLKKVLKLCRQSSLFLHLA